MKMNTIYRLIAMVLIFATVTGWSMPAVYADQLDYTCDTYAECTSDGSQIYIIAKDDCAIRKEPNNEGDIVARGSKGQLISVNRVFWTAKLRRWAEINVIGSSEKFYIYIGNVTPHESHSFVSLASTPQGSIDFCRVCGLSVAISGTDVATCDFTCVADQAVKGNFSQYNASYVSLAAQILIGEIPYIGTIADVRDLIADVLKGEPGWILALDALAFAPFIGALKFSDEIGTVGKRANDLSDVAYKGAKNDIFWGFWDDYPKTQINGHEYAKIGDYNYTQHAVESFINPSIQTNQQFRINPKTGKGSWVEHSRGIPPSYTNWVLTDAVAEGLVSVVEEAPVKGVRRWKYTCGTLNVILEEGNIVVSVYSKNLK